MTTDADPTGRPSAERRAMAIVALVCPVLALIVAVIAIRGAFVELLVAVAVLVVLVLAGWFAVTRTGAARIGAAVVAVLAVAVLVAQVAFSEHHAVALLVVLALGAVSIGATRVALHEHVPASATGTPVGPASKPVLIMNLKSGGGKAERFHLEDACRARGIEPIVLRPGNDLRQLAEDAVAGGADVIGMAGGDGSQALVASVAAEHDVAHVCIPAGTRNHFALDLGLDRDDVVGALDAFAEGVERRIDLAEVNGRVFVNNVSLGVYAKIVQSPEYRDAKRQTTLAMLPQMLGPDAPPFDLHFTGPDGSTVDGAQVVQVSNNPYRLTRLIGGFGTRARIDTGTLGLAAVHLTRDTDVARFVALETAGRLSRFEGWMEWAAPRFEVTSDAPVEAGVDGEALLLDPPLVFTSRPGAVRIRIPTHAPGLSPAAQAPGSALTAAHRLVRVAGGRPAVEPDDGSGEA